MVVMVMAMAVMTVAVLSLSLFLDFIVVAGLVYDRELRVLLPALLAVIPLDILGVLLRDPHAVAVEPVFAVVASSEREPCYARARSFCWHRILTS